MSNQLDAFSEKKRCYVVRIVVANQKGGVGKSTIAYHLSCALTHPLLVVDVDPQSDLTRFYGPEDIEGVWSILSGELTEKDVIRKSPVEGVDYIASGGQDLAGLDVLASRKQVSIHRLKGIGREYRHVIFDTPGWVGNQLMAALLASEFVLIPVTPGEASAQGVKTIFGEVANARMMGATLKVALVPCMFGPGKKQRAILDEVQSASVLTLPEIPRLENIREKTDSRQMLTGVGLEAFAALAKALECL